uniref:BAR domain-containing protein n=1 Tax=Plectus sambesii TaxID=2011161 RepID=A0A914X668_9BILA
MRTQLRLDEALDDTPQLRSLLKLFEEDSGNLRQWCRALDSALVRLTTAQTEIAAATAHLSAVVAAYQDQRLPLEQTELDMPDVTGRLTQTIGEVGSWMEVASQQLSNSVVFPVRRLLTELDQLHNVHKPMFHDCRTALTDAEERFAKAGRKDAPRKLEEVNNDVFLAKQNFHQV